jgi:hypothetical protein
MKNLLVAAFKFREGVNQSVYEYVYTLAHNSVYCVAYTIFFKHLKNLKFTFQIVNLPASRVYPCFNAKTILNSFFFF